MVIPMDNFNQNNESDVIREKSNALKEMIMQNSESSATGGGHLPPARKKRGERKVNAIFEKAVTRSRMTADEYRAALVAKAEAKAKEEARLAAEEKAKEEAKALEELKRQAEAEAKAQAEEIERLKAQAAAEAAAREEELARVRAEAEEAARLQAEEAARLAKEEAEEAARKAQEEALQAKEAQTVADDIEDGGDSFESADRFFDETKIDAPVTESTDELFKTETVDEVVATSEKESVSPVFEEETPDIEEAPLFEEEKSDVEEAPLFEEETPVVEEAPLFEEETPVVEEAPLFVEETPVFENETPIIEESPVFEEETPIIKEETPVFEEDSVFEETTIVEDQDELQNADEAQADAGEQFTYEAEPAETDIETEPDDFGFAIDTMTKSETATELKYDHSAYRTRRKHHDTPKTTDIPWVIPGNIQESTPAEEITESTPEPQEEIEVAQPEESPAISTPIPVESRSEREERDVLSLLNILDEKNKSDSEEETKGDTESVKPESDDSLFEDANNAKLSDKIDELFETDDIAESDEALVSTRDLNADAVSANTLFDTEEIIEESPAEEVANKSDHTADDLFETETIENASNNDAVVSESVKSDDSFEERLADMPKIPESNDDLFETESIDTADVRTPFSEESVDENNGDTPVEKAVPVESLDDLFDEETVVDKPDRFDTKPIADKESALFSEEPISEKQVDVPEEPAAGEKQDDLSSEKPKASVKMLDDLLDLDDHVTDQLPIQEKTETPKPIKQETENPDPKPAEVPGGVADFEMVDLDSLNVNRVVDNGAGDMRTPSEILTDDTDKVEAVDLSAPKEQPKASQINISELDSIDDLFSVETVPEKVATKVKTVTETISPEKASDADSLFESEIISPGSRTAPLPNLDPKATTPLEKQDMSAQSKVSKAYDALFEEDEV